MVKDDIYQLLEIKKSAPAELVKKAFKEFAKHNHPDFFPGDTLREEKFKQVASAYQKWQLAQKTITEITRIKHASQYNTYSSLKFIQWRFSCKA